MAISNGTGSVAGNDQNIAQARTPRTYSKFDLKAHRFNTERYGEYTPIIAFEAYPEDKLPLRLAHNLQTYTMSQPLMQDIYKVKEVFSVPMEAILPLNWEKFFDNPVRGDDTPVDAGPCIVDFWSKVASFSSALRTALGTVLSGSNTTDVEALQAVLRFLVIEEMFYSDGSLMATLGCKGSPYLSIYRIDTATTGAYLSIDEYFDFVVSKILAVVQSCTLISDGVSYSWTTRRNQYGNGYSGIYVPFRHLISLLRDDPTSYISSLTLDTSVVSNGSLHSYFQTQLMGSNDWQWSYQDSFPAGVLDPAFNTQFLSAYQLCCAHYYSNDHIDFIYSADLFRQLIGNYLTYYSTYNTHFTRNGIQYQYDYLSAHSITTCLDVPTANYMVRLLICTTGTTNPDPSCRAKLGFLSAIFSFRRSLKYLDYFTGSRANPLAVGSTSVTVSGSTVSVIDITRNIQKQRFLNSVNRIGHQFEQYIKGLFGGSMPAPDYHNPFDLARTTDLLFADETQNTGSVQFTDAVTTTTNVRGHSNNYMFEIQPDRPCIIIAMSYYDVPRVHMRATDKSFFHQDRFDYFNPFMQYVGDQPITIQELGLTRAAGTLPVSGTFSYTMRHMEFKQLYNTASGGFIHSLPGFIFPALDYKGNLYHISPEYIRCTQSEFDNFYNSLTGYSLATYFHFIVDNLVDFTGTRQMAYSPQILG